jgi:hypothetical protein
VAEPLCAAAPPAKAAAPRVLARDQKFRAVGNQYMAKTAYTAKKINPKTEPKAQKVCLLI